MQESNAADGRVHTPAPCRYQFVHSSVPLFARAPTRPTQCTVSLWGFRSESRVVNRMSRIKGQKPDFVTGAMLLSPGCTLTTPQGMILRIGGLLPSPPTPTYSPTHPPPWDTHMLTTHTPCLHTGGHTFAHSWDTHTSTTHSWDTHT